MPKTVKVGEETTVTATVQNNGLHAVTDGQCAVAFTVNGKEMGVVPVEGIVAPFKGTTACSLNFVPTIFFGSMMEVKTKVVCRGDETPANDEAAMSATVRLPSVSSAGLGGSVRRMSGAWGEPLSVTGTSPVFASA